MLVRYGREGEAEALRALEIAADTRFLGVGMKEVAARNPPSEAFFNDAIEEERLWVAEVDYGEPAGYAAAVFLDGEPHLQIVSVHPSHQGRGVGRALVNAVADWAHRSGASEVTLTTFRDVAWNRPLYERLGFEVIEDDDLSPGLRTAREEEAALGLDSDGPRVAMRRRLDLDQ